MHQLIAGFNPILVQFFSSNPPYQLQDFWVLGRGLRCTHTPLGGLGDEGQILFDKGPMEHGIKVYIEKVISVYVVTIDIYIYNHKNKLATKVDMNVLHV